MIRIELRPASDYRASHYGVLFESAYVYRTGRSYSPTRVVVWSNTSRPNARNGEPVRHGDYGPIDGGAGRYLDPHNKATDAERSVLLSTESTVIDAYGTGTGSKESGQVWADDKLCDGDALTLAYPDGTEETLTARFPRYSNGHGFAE